LSEEGGKESGGVLAVLRTKLNLIAGPKKKSKQRRGWNLVNSRGVGVVGAVEELEVCRVRTVIYDPPPMI